MVKPSRSAAVAKAADPIARAAQAANAKAAPMTDAAKHRRIAEMLQDIRAGIDQLSRNAEAHRNRFS